VLAKKAQGPLTRRLVQVLVKDPAAMIFLSEVVHRNGREAGYIRAVKGFSAFLEASPATASAEDLRRYRLHLVESGVGAPTINHSLTALRFLFLVTLRKPAIVLDMPFVREPRRLPVVLSPQEVARLLDAAPGLKYKAALSIAYGAGLRASEVFAQDRRHHSDRMVIGVSGPGPQDRYALSRHRSTAARVVESGRRPPRAWLTPGGSLQPHATPRQLSRKAYHHAPCFTGRRSTSPIAAHAAQHQLRHLLEQRLNIRPGCCPGRLACATPAMLFPRPVEGHIGHRGAAARRSRRACRALPGRHTLIAYNSCQPPLSQVPASRQAMAGRTRG
jgi:integrase